jgi:tRNA-(ms[2]io[6]A)-hydroxylase
MKASVPLAPADFLGCPTPEAWIVAALADLETLLVDHAHCERKAASNALALMHRYPEDPLLLDKLSRLAREELRHFEQVQKVLRARGLRYRRMTPARYAEGLHALVRSHEPARQLDSLVLGAFIEARSCERFERLAPRLPGELGEFYRGLCAAESRHYGDYLVLAAREADPAELAARVAVFRRREAELIAEPDPQFRFHSGAPV